MRGTEPIQPACAHARYLVLELTRANIQHSAGSRTQYSIFSDFRTQYSIMNIPIFGTMPGQWKVKGKRGRKGDHHKRECKNQVFQNGKLLRFARCFSVSSVPETYSLSGSVPPGAPPSPSIGSCARVENPKFAAKGSLEVLGKLKPQTS